MKNCMPQPIRLPPIDFVAGTTKTLTFRIYSDVNEPYETIGCTANFAVILQTDLNHTLISKQMIVSDSNSEDSNMLTVTLDSGDTIEMGGQYLYQITILDSSGIVEIPYHGNLYIYPNINKDASGR